MQRPVLLVLLALPIPVALPIPASAQAADCRLRGVGPPISIDIGVGLGRMSGLPRGNGGGGAPTDAVAAIGLDRVPAFGTICGSQRSPPKAARRADVLHGETTPRGLLAGPPAGRVTALPDTDDRSHDRAAP